ncbi:dihydroorotase [Sulfurospirillum sp. T05]|uniref:Dihydroorotase n=1 Tax=Sulfurospirillum tamanense TaxID=2813362 RepID=A0ABS2WTR3_9BACT|nr:dihydroorotase [Sulfurospirillum tamanensis]MBN2964985.1 dihydroorotase [Sulfurospirillum tamanensis]
MKTLIKNGTIINADGRINANVVIEGETIVEITTEEVQADVVIDATGMLVMPGLIDMHVHFRDPGQEYKDDVISGSETAVAGGVTTCLPMANTTPINDNASITRAMIAKAKERGLIDLLPIGAVTQGFKGDRIVEMGDMIEAGAVAFSDDGLPVSSSTVMRAALEYSRGFNSFVISHSEDCSLCRHGVMNEGPTSTILGLKGMPSEKEEIAVARDMLLAKLTKGHIHIAHVSSAWSLKLIELARKEGVSITCEVAPHHFSFSDEHLLTYDTYFKMSPPLRSKCDVEAMKEGLRSGLVDVIATDHAPHHTDEKFVEFDKAPFGILGLQTLVPLTLALVKEGVITLERMVELTSANPAKILHLDNKGKIAKGMLADIAIIDPEMTYVYDEKLNKSKSKNSPLLNQTLTGAAVKTLKSGRVVFDFPNCL